MNFICFKYVLAWFTHKKNMFKNIFRILGYKPILKPRIQTCIISESSFWNKIKKKMLNNAPVVLVKKIMEILSWKSCIQGLNMISVSAIMLHFEISPC
jgi:hypothetical protein